MVSSACGVIRVFIIYRRKVSVLCDCICEKGSHLPVVGYNIFQKKKKKKKKERERAREREREREREHHVASTV